MKVNQKGIKTYLEENGGNLDAFSKTITRVHGGGHPEIKEVTEQYFKIRETVAKEEDVTESQLEELKILSNHFKHPNGTCEGTANTYQQYGELYKLALTK